MSVSCTVLLRIISRLFQLALSRALALSSPRPHSVADGPTRIRIRSLRMTHCSYDIPPPTRLNKEHINTPKVGAQERSATRPPCAKALPYSALFDNTTVCLNQQHALQWSTWALITSVSYQHLADTAAATRT
jgi:hypothetical protein